MKQTLVSTISNRRYISSPKTGSLYLASMLGACLAPGIARGDVQIVSKVTVSHAVIPATGTPVITFNSAGTTASEAKTSPANAQAEASSSPPEIVTTYYHGSDARTEVTGGAVTIYHGGEGKVYTLDPSLKTYYVQALKDLEEPLTPPAGAQAITMKVDDDISFSPGAETRAFAGINTKDFLISGTVTVTPERAGGGSAGGRGGRGGGGGGRHRGGGGFGGGFPSGGSSRGGGEDGDHGVPTTRVHIAPVQVSGEFWLADSVKVANDKKATLLPSVYVSVPGENFVFKPLADHLKKDKEIPLSSRIALTRTSPQGVQESVTVTSEATSVTQSAQPDSLFQLPVGYTEVSAPVTPSSN